MKYEPRTETDCPQSDPKFSGKPSGDCELDGRREDIVKAKQTNE